MHGSPAALSFTSTLKMPDALGSRSWIAAALTSETLGSHTVFASAGVDDIPLGLWAPPKYDSRSIIFMTIGRPSFHTPCTLKSRPGKYSDSVNTSGAMPRMSRQYTIQLRACSGVVTGIAPIEPEPDRMRHQRRRRGAS